MHENPYKIRRFLVAPTGIESDTLAQPATTDDDKIDDI